MKDLSPYFSRFSESGMKILENSLAETKRRNQNLISPEHILYALMNEEAELFDRTMSKHSIDPQQVRVAVEKRLEKSPQYTGEGFEIAPTVTQTFKHSMDKARTEGRQTIEASDICHALATWTSDLTKDILQNP